MKNDRRDRMLLCEFGGSKLSGRKLFREEMAPEGAPKRCTDGCPHRFCDLAKMKK